MCLLVFAWQADSRHPVILAGNRDERHARASAAAGFWKDAPQVLAGRDLEAGGTWLGLSGNGRYAVVTNYRDGLNPPKAPRSRGELTADFLEGSQSPDTYVMGLQERAREYGAFSLLCGDRNSLWYFSNRGGEPLAVQPGIHALSNHLLDTPWPKVQAGKARLKLLLDGGAVTSEALLRMLADRTPAEGPLPDTGIGAELERRVSATFVADPVYGTRCSTLLLMRRDGATSFLERRFDSEGQPQETHRFEFAGDGA